MTFFIIYYTIGLVIAVVIATASYYMLGKQGLYELYKSEYEDTKLSPTQVEVYVYITLLVLLPFLYGVFALHELGKKAFKKLAPKEKS